MNIDEIDIYDQFLNGFNNDLKRIENTECFYTDFPYIFRNCLERRAALHFAFENGILGHEGFFILSDMEKDILKKLNEKLNDRLKWHGARLDEHLGNVPAALIMVNCCNDLLKPLGMDFNTK